MLDFNDDGAEPGGCDEGDRPTECPRSEAEAPESATKSRGSGGVMLSAAMLALGEILEPEKTTVEIVQTDDDPEPDLGFDLDFGGLPPLD